MLAAEAVDLKGKKLEKMPGFSSNMLQSPLQSLWFGVWGQRILVAVQKAPLHPLPENFRSPAFKTWHALGLLGFGVQGFKVWVQQSQS